MTKYENMQAILGIIPKVLEAAENIYKKFGTHSSLRFRSVDNEYGIDFDYQNITLWANNNQVLTIYGYELQVYSTVDLSSNEVEVDIGTEDDNIVLLYLAENIIGDYNTDTKTLNIPTMMDEVPFDTDADIDEVLFKLSLEHDRTQQLQEVKDNIAVHSMILKLKGLERWDVWNVTVGKLDLAHELIDNLLIPEFKDS